MQDPLTRYLNLYPLSDATRRLIGVLWCHVLLSWTKLNECDLSVVSVFLFIACTFQYQTVTWYDIYSGSDGVVLTVYPFKRVGMDFPPHVCESMYCSALAVQWLHMLFALSEAITVSDHIWYHFALGIKDHVKIPSPHLIQSRSKTSLTLYWWR